MQNIMSKKNKKNLHIAEVPALANLIFSGKNRHGVTCSLHHSLDNFIIKKESAEITLLSYDQAEAWAEEMGHCSSGAEFNYRLHNPNGDPYDEERAPADIAFSLQSQKRREFRVQELLELREFQKCTIRSDRSVTTIEITNEDRDNIIEMLSYLNYEPDAFNIPGAFDIRNANFECLGYDSSISKKGAFQFDSTSSCDSDGPWCAVYFFFWHSHTKMKKTSMPKFNHIKHAWINVYDGILPDGEPRCQLIRYVIGAIIRFQLEYESNWARDPERELKKFPGNPDEVHMRIVSEEPSELTIF